MAFVVHIWTDTSDWISNLQKLLAFHCMNCHRWAHDTECAAMFAGCKRGLGPQVRGQEGPKKNRWIVWETPAEPVACLQLAICVCVRPWLVNACHCKFLCPAHFHLPATSWNCVRAYTPDFGRCIARLATAGLKVHCWWLCAWFGMSAWWHSLRPIWSSDIVLTEWFCKFPQITYS